MTKRDGLFFEEMYWGLPLPWLLRSPWDGGPAALLVPELGFRPVVHALIPGKTVGADVSCTLPILNFNDQNWPFRRRRIHARSADLSASGPSMRFPGR